MAAPLLKAIHRYCTIDTIENGEKLFIPYSISDLLFEIEQATSNLSRLRLDEEGRLSLLLRSDSPTGSLPVRLNLFEKELDLQDLVSATGVSKSIVDSATDHLRRLKRRIEATFLCSIEAGRCEIRARKKCDGHLETVAWSEFRYFRIMDWKNGFAEGPSGSALFDIKVGEATAASGLADPRFASVVRRYRSSRPDVRSLMIIIMEHRSTPLGKGIGIKAQEVKGWPRAKVSRNTFTSVRNFLDAEVLILMPDEQKVLLGLLKAIS